MTHRHHHRARRARRLAGLLLALALAGCGNQSEQPAPPPPPDLSARVDGLILQLVDPVARKRAHEELLSLGKPATPLLLARIQDESQVIRWEIVNLLGKLRDERAITSLVNRSLDEKAPQVRQRAVWALGQYEGSSFVVSQLKSALSSGEESVRWNAAVALSSFDAADGLAILHAAVADPARRGEALQALVRVHDQETAAIIAAALPGFALHERENAMMALGKIGGDVAVEALIGALRDESPMVRWRACFCLAQVGDPRAATVLEVLKRTEDDPKVLQHMDLAIRKLKLAQPRK